MRIHVVLMLVLALRTASAEPVTSDRLKSLPQADQTAWQKYLERSQATARADQAALQLELAANGMTSALQAPDGGDFKLPARADDSWYASDDAAKLADV